MNAVDEKLIEVAYQAGQNDVPLEKLKEIAAETGEQA